MKYKTLAVAVGSVILFAGCQNPQLIKKLDQLEAKLESAERKIRVVVAENNTLKKYKRKREADDAVVKRAEAESAKLDKLLGTWRCEEYTGSSKKLLIRISRPPDVYGPLTLDNLSVKVKRFGSYSWTEKVEISRIHQDHFQINAGFTCYQLKLTAPESGLIWETRYGEWPSDEYDDPKQLEIEKISS